MPSWISRCHPHLARRAHRLVISQSHQAATNKWASHSEAIKKSRRKLVLASQFCDNRPLVLILTRRTLA
jgi:hypothetical protein